MKEDCQWCGFKIPTQGMQYYELHGNMCRRCETLISRVVTVDRKNRISSDQCTQFILHNHI